MDQDLNYYHLIHQKIASLLLYQSVLEDEVGQAFLEILDLIYFRNQKPIDINCLQVYGLWVKSLASRCVSWQDYIIRKILIDDNPFSQEVQHNSLENLLNL